MDVAIDDLEIWQAPKIEQLRPGHSRIAIGPATVHPLCFLLQQRRKRPNSGPAACRIKISRCSKRTSRALRFLLRTLLLLRCHNATPWFLMNLIRQGLSSRLRRQTTAKQWCIINERRMNRPPKAVSVGSQPKADQRRRARDMLAADPGGGGHRERHATSYFDLAQRYQHDIGARSPVLLPANARQVRRPA